MARSVDYLNRAEIVVYKTAHELEQDDWGWWEEDIIENLKSTFPSLYEPTKERWDGNETQIILENGLCEIGLSEYNGLVSISIRPKEEDYNYRWIEGIAKNWIGQIKNKFETFGDLIRIGGFSNGEAMFKSKDLKDTYSSKEGYCDWA